MREEQLSARGSLDVMVERYVRIVEEGVRIGPKHPRAALVGKQAQHARHLGEVRSTVWRVDINIRIAEHAVAVLLGVALLVGEGEGLERSIETYSGQVNTKQQTDVSKRLRKRPGKRLSGRALSTGEIGD